MSSGEGQVGVNTNLQKQDLAQLDITKLTPLSPEVISRQATINIGTIGHVAHGKSTVVKAISGVQTVRFKNELERNITIKLERISYQKLLEISKSPKKLRKYVEQQDAKMKFRKVPQQNKLLKEHIISNCPQTESMTLCSSIINLELDNTKGYENWKVDSLEDFKNEPKPPKKIKKQKEYEVEAIEALEEDQAEPLFLVKWKGYASGKNTWEPLENIRDCSVLEEFIDGQIAKYKATIDIIYSNILQEIKDQNFHLSYKDLTIEEIEKYDNYAYILNVIILAIYKLAGSKRKVKEGIIKERLKAQICIKPLYSKRIEQLKFINEWKEYINNTDAFANIHVENNVDLEDPPKKFSYTNDVIPAEGMLISDDPPIGCECPEGCNYRSQCCANMSGSYFAYNSRKRLRVLPGTPIFECNKRCKCGPDCINRVIQNGRRNSLTIFKTNNGCGWGLKTNKAICEGEYVCEYVGEIITAEEADRRGKIYDAEGRTYLFDLDFNEDNDSIYTIDAAKFGNVSHFINHSCDPNCRVWPVWVNCLDLNLPRLALFAIRRIEPGEELTFDYTNQNSHERASNQANQNEEGKRFLCKCGAKNCRKYLFQ